MSEISLLALSGRGVVRSARTVRHALDGYPGDPALAPVGRAATGYAGLMIHRTRDQMNLEERPNMRGGEGVVTVEHALTKEELLGHGRLFAITTVPVGGSVGLHQHDNEQEFYLLLSGTGRYQHDDDFYDVGPGTLVSVDDHHSHGLVNTGDEPIEMLTVILNT